MKGRDLQLLISLIEDEFEDGTHQSITATIDSVRHEMRPNNPTNLELFKHLRNKHGRATGRIARVATKRLFESANRTDESVIEIIDSISNQYDCQPNEVTDDMLCRAL